MKASAAFERIIASFAAAIDQTLRVSSTLLPRGPMRPWPTTVTWTAWSHIDETAQRIDALIGDNQYDARVIVQDLRITADNLRDFSETVKHSPARALVAGPPDKVRLPQTPSEISP
jgi:hypothetical protein